MPQAQLRKFLSSKNHMLFLHNHILPPRITNSTWCHKRFLLALSFSPVPTMESINQNPTSFFQNNIPKHDPISKTQPHTIEAAKFQIQYYFLPILKTLAQGMRPMLPQVLVGVRIVSLPVNPLSPQSVTSHEDIIILNQKNPSPNCYLCGFFYFQLCQGPQSCFSCTNRVLCIKICQSLSRWLECRYKGHDP